MKSNATIYLLNNKITSLSNYSYEPIDFTNKKINPKFIGEGELNLIFIFSDKGCISCIDELINKINKIDIKYDPYLKIYYLGKYPERIGLNRLKKKFDCISVDNLFNQEVEVFQPLGLLVNHNGVIILSHEKVINSSKFTDNFIKSVQNILDIII